ncbi:hypothetical protein PHLGIDRAFT_65260 [Phlebiopsis gigantea 11061_1 CR5-6]|uniref:AB hydrolase-1 domain-containing protein n=1 Tax=Phlebiopsis gigantea (strain 11061_1 CR5-6) TaxID=745531 RepID=A0A0C3PT90_PHLG1|nr:hypothetical protein PHLGIDRAFT_65260 [Phlebiopsis gigantea 11061_1 CR5-6]
MAKSGQNSTENGPAEAEILHDIAESLHTSRSRDLSFYIVLILAVIPLWSVVPAAWAFVIYALHSGKIWSFAWKGRSLFALALVEAWNLTNSYCVSANSSIQVFFSVYHYHLAKCIRAPSSASHSDFNELQAAFRRVLQSGLAELPEYGYDEEDVGRPGSPEEDIIALERHDPRAVDFRNYLRTWFGKVPWSSVRRQEMFAWLHWSIYNAPFTSLDALPPARQKVLLEVLSMLEKRAGTSIPDGTNPHARPLLLTLDPVSVTWRPFFWYAGVALSNYYQRRRYESKYILRIPHAWTAESGPRPVVFMHGLGLGLTQYQLFLGDLFHAVNDRPVLVPLQPHVSQEIFHARYLRPMGRHESADVLAELLVKLGWARDQTKDVDVAGQEDANGVTVVSHSNGSFLHAWLLKAHPEMVSRSCFVDPVTFCSWEGDLCYNFIYRRCTTGLELVMKYFVGMELGVANFLQRHFDWSANALWYEQIPNARDPSRTMFFLGGRDAIVDASRVKRYLTSHGIRKGLWFDPDGRHGQALLAGGKEHAEILRWLCEPTPRL